MVQTFDTDCARIGVLICYDVEFPELSRIMADQGMQILFVPFLTDTQNGYSRVRVCAQARAIENECFVAIAGSVGNLPRVHNMDIQYAQSGVFTPCDFAFPTDGKRAEATPNTEMILVSDVDLDLLNELHTYGSVRNLRDRRHDLYEPETEALTPYVMKKPFRNIRKGFLHTQTLTIQTMQWRNTVSHCFRCKDRTKFRTVQSLKLGISCARYGGRLPFFRPFGRILF